MPMTAEEIRTLRALMEYEAARTAPPRGFPALPDIPAGRYTDPRFFQLEMAHLWRKSWLLAAHSDELPAPGSYMTWDLAGEPVVLVRGEDAVVRAFFNTCRHRGAPVAMAAHGSGRRLTCPYHGWSYALDGRLLGVRDAQDFTDLDFSTRSLVPVRCEAFGNLLFVNFDPHAPSLLEWLGPIAAEWEEFQFDQCRLAARHVFDLECNWKIAMEANTEVYHVRSIHPTTVAPALDDRRNVNTLYANGHGRMVAPTPAGMATLDIMPVDPRIAQIDTVGEIARSCTQSYGIFPNLVAPLSQYVIPPLVFWPNGINRCRLETWTSRHRGRRACARTCGQRTTDKNCARCCSRTPSSAPGSRSRWSRAASPACHSVTRSRASTTGTRPPTASSASTTSRPSCASRR
jgi:phenylpropionate dioxygenase-like ring-hydroxylating dioxygenase large terminal subunit